jgi:hypothetical protein
MTIDNLASDGKPVTLKIHRPNRKDNPANSYLHVTVAGNIAMRLMTTRHLGFFLVRRWRVEVATGFDMTLVYWHTSRSDNDP